MQLLNLASVLPLLPLVAGSPLDARHHRHTSCTKASGSDFKWTVENFDFHASYIFSTPAHQNSWGYVDFNLTNPAVGPVKCSAQSDQINDFFYGTFPYSCTSSNGTVVAGSGAAKFDFSRPSGVLNLNQTWTCSDQDPKYPTTYFASGTTNLTLSCSETYYQNQNWTLGQIYSDREIKCQPVTVEVKPYARSAIA